MYAKLIDTARKKHLVRKICIAFFVIFFVMVLIHVISMLTLDQSLEYTEISFSSGQISPELDGYTIAFITDTHAIPFSELEAVTNRISLREVDLLLLGGDYADGAGVWETMEIISGTKTKNGIYGVQGNHDRLRTAKAAMEKHNIQFLYNEGDEIVPGFYLGGVGDLWYRESDVSVAIQKAKPEDFVLLLSHNPDISMQQDMTSVDLVLSGHTHGGQITFFGIHKPLLKYVTDYGNRFGGGWAIGMDSVPVFVSRGTGQSKRYPRVFARPEVVYLTLTAIPPLSGDINGDINKE